jgi:SPFH domain / Band 7 family
LFAFIIALILMLGGIIVIIGGALTARGAAVGGGAGAFVLGIIILLVSMANTVGVSQVGIVTAFGHVQGHDLGPGIHFLAPWDNVTLWDDSVQQDSFTGKDCLEIRIAGQQSACLDVNLFWKDNPAGSDQQFRQYQTFGRVANAYFSRGVVTQYFNNVFETFDPVALVSTSPAGQVGGTTVSTLTKKVLQEMRIAYKGTAQITSLSSGQIAYDSQVESALSAVVKAKANTNVAQQNEQTAANQKIADQREQQDLNGAVVEQNCLNMTQQALQAGDALSPAWNCTGSSGVLVGAGK